MVTASGEVLVWGEAGGALDNFADALERYMQMLGPGGNRYRHGFGGNGAEQYRQLRLAGRESVHQWVACLNPPQETFLNAFRDFFETSYASPAAELGYSTWGIKEVQSGIETARFIKCLYPEAKFVFLVRNPLDCLTSIKRRNWMGHHGNGDPLSFYSSHWQRLAKDFLEADFGYRLRYEDIMSSPETIDDLVKYLEISLPADFASKSRVDWHAENDRSLSFFERRSMLRIVGEEMEKYGYR
jgi:hypothetical protein